MLCCLHTYPVIATWLPGELTPILQNSAKEFPQGCSGKESDCNAGDAGDLGLIRGSGGSPREGNGNPLQYSCLENPMDRGVWQAIVHGVAKESDTTYWSKKKQQLNSKGTDPSLFGSPVYPIHNFKIAYVPPNNLNPGLKLIEFKVYVSFDFELCS